MILVPHLETTISCIEVFVLVVNKLPCGSDSLAQFLVFYVVDELKVSFSDVRIF